MERKLLRYFARRVLISLNIKHISINILHTKKKLTLFGKTPLGHTWKVQIRAVKFDHGSLTGVGQSLDKLGDSGSFLANSHVDTIQLLLLIGAVVESLLVDDGINGNGSLTSLTITNDQFSLSTTNWHQAANAMQPM